MAYQKHTWVTREVIKRDLLQNIEDGIYNEEQRAIEAENGLSSSISSETSRAIAKENQLSQGITDVANNLSAEVTRAGAKETELETAISDETTRATAAESSLSDGISNVNTALSAEITRASGAEGTLRTDLNAEITRAQGAESTLTTNLASEVSRATAAESALQTYVDQKLTTLYKPDGSVYFSALPALSLQRLNYVYNVKDAFTTTADFTDGAGKSYPAGTNVAITSVDGDYYDEVTPVGTENPSEEGWYEYNSVDDEYELSEDTTVDSGKTYYTYSDSKLFYDCLAGFVDLSGYVQKTDIASTTQLGLVKPDGTTITIDGDGTIHSVGGGQGSAEAAERMIAPIEPDATESIHTYAVGARLILNEILYEVIAPINIGDELITYEDDPTNANVKESDDLTTLIDAIEDDIADVVAALNTLDGKAYKTDDAAETDLADGDYIPFYDTSASAKRKSLWSNIIAKIKSALGITTSGGTFLRKDGSWATPTDTTYANGTGITIGTGNAINHSNSVTAGTAKGDNSKTLTFGGTFTVPSVTYDAQGHVTAKGTTTMTMPANPNSDTKVVQTATSTNANYEVLFSETADNTTRTEGARKYSNLKFNPSTGNLQATQLNGVTIGSSPKFTDNNTTYAAGTGVTISGSNNAINVTYGSAASTACQGNDSRLSNSRTPTSHASTGTGYGAGNASNYGHVKVSDTYTSNVGAAANSIAASQTALYNVYNTLNSMLYKGTYITPTIHNCQSGSWFRYFEFNGFIICEFWLKLSVNIGIYSAYRVVSGMPQNKGGDINHIGVAKIDDSYGTVFISSAGTDVNIVTRETGLSIGNVVTGATMYAKN